MSSTAHPSPQRHRVGFPTLLFGAAAAPIFWLGQLVLGYAVTAFVCFPGDHPVPLAGQSLGSALMAFDVVAILVAAAGGAVALWSFNQVRHEKEGGARHAMATGEGRARFLALWGIFSSLWFFCAILFNTIASVTVPPCLI